MRPPSAPARAVAGVIGGYLMFGSARSAGHRVCGGVNLALAEAVATFGLVFAIVAVSQARRQAVAGAVGLDITAAYGSPPRRPSRTRR